MTESIQGTTWFVVRKISGKEKAVIDADVQSWKDIVLKSILEY